MLVRSGMAREMEDKLLFGSVRAGIRAYRVWRNRTGRESADNEEGAYIVVRGERCSTVSARR
jgi:hypothetical protein